MKTTKIVVFSLLTLATSIVGFAQPADEVIAKHLAALGGVDKLKALKSVKMEAKINTPQAPGMDVLMSMTAVNNKGYRQEISVMGMQMIQAYDGETAWINAPAPMGGSGQPEPLPAEQAERAKEQTDLAGSLVDYKTKGHSVELLGKEDLEGTEVYKLKITKKNGDLEYDFIDASNYLVIKSETVTKMKGQEIKGSSTFSNYKQVEGLTFPFSIEQDNPMMGGASTITFTNIVLNPTIDEASFKMPAKK